MKFSSLAGQPKPETPAQNAVSVSKLKLAQLRREVFEIAVKEAAISGVIEPTYDKLADSIKHEFSFKTFERLVANLSKSTID